MNPKLFGKVSSYLGNTDSNLDEYVDGLARTNSNLDAYNSKLGEHVTEADKAAAEELAHQERLHKQLRKLQCKCGRGNKIPKRSTCATCHAEYQRKWLVDHPLTREQLRQKNARSYASFYLKKGKLVRGACDICGNPKVHMYHEDYDKPLVIRWLCKEHESWRSIPTPVSTPADLI